MPILLALNENSVNYEELTETLAALLENEMSEKPFLIKDGVKIIL